jgi:hypothetical protein
MCANSVATTFVGNDLINFAVSPGHVVNWLFFIAFKKLLNFGAKHAACRYVARSFFVCLFLMITFNLCDGVG